MKKAENFIVLVLLFFLIEVTIDITVFYLDKHFLIQDLFIKINKQQTDIY